VLTAAESLWVEGAANVAVEKMSARRAAAMVLLIVRFRFIEKRIA
jgi:hypothetical protein